MLCSFDICDESLHFLEILVMTSLEGGGDVIELSFFFDFTFALLKIFPESLNFSLEHRNFAATLLASSTMMM